MDAETRAAVLKVAAQLKDTITKLDKEKGIAMQLAHECNKGLDRYPALRKSERRIEGWRSTIASQFEVLLARAKEEESPCQSAGSASSTSSS